MQSQYGYYGFWPVVWASEPRYQYDQRLVYKGEHGNAVVYSRPQKTNRATHKATRLSFTLLSSLFSLLPTSETPRADSSPPPRWSSAARSPASPDPESAPHGTAGASPPGQTFRTPARPSAIPHSCFL